MGRTKKELDSDGDGEREIRGRLVGQMENLLSKSHTRLTYMWFIFHNLLKTLEKQKLNLRAICYP